jgi:hypothetical protein
VTIQVIDWPEISGYVGSRRELEEWGSVPTDSLWGRMKLLGSLRTTKGTKRSPEKGGVYYSRKKTREKA